MERYTVHYDSPQQAIEAARFYSGMDSNDVIVTVSDNRIEISLSPVVELLAGTIAFLSRGVRGVFFRRHG